MIIIESKGSFKKTESFLKSMSKNSAYDNLDFYARLGVSALESATPVESGLSAKSWNYEIKDTPGSYSITWTNDNLVNGVPVVILLQYGHGTTGGTYVHGVDFINPALRPIFDKISNDVWNEVVSS